MGRWRSVAEDGLFRVETLTVIRNHCENGAAVAGRVEWPIDHCRWTMPGRTTWLNRADELGVFPIGIQRPCATFCRKFAISSIEHITALKIALYRPGPMRLPDFIKRRHGHVSSEYGHPLLEPICGETTRLFVENQEQVMQPRRCSPVHVGRRRCPPARRWQKDEEKMQKQREVSVRGCAATNQIPAAAGQPHLRPARGIPGYGFKKIPRRRPMPSSPTKPPT